MKILVTGAHFTTAVAVIEELKKNKNVDVVYVGRKTTQEGDTTPSAESQVLPGMGVKFISLTAGRLQRKFTIYTVPSLLKIPIGFIQAFYILLKEKPNVILSFGGYVGVPIVIVGWLLSIPIIIHEQTLVSGLANSISSWVADKIAISFPRKSSNKTILTGNPLRKEILEERGHRSNESKLIFITGGNQGSHAINLAVEGCLDKLTRLADVVHQTGDSKFKDFERLEKIHDDKYQVSKFINAKEMAYLLKNADLVISRAGINTLTELAFFGTPAIVIPLPFLYKNEQMENAKFFENLGLVKILPQSKLSSETLLENTENSLKNIENLKKQAKKAQEVIIPDAAKRLALETYAT